MGSTASLWDLTAQPTVAFLLGWSLGPAEDREDQGRSPLLGEGLDPEEVDERSVGKQEQQDEGYACLFINLHSVSLYWHVVICSTA
jgi:hypothetical protein